MVESNKPQLRPRQSAHGAGLPGSHAAPRPSRRFSSPCLSVNSRARSTASCTPSPPPPSRNASSIPTSAKPNSSSSAPSGSGSRSRTTHGKGKIVLEYKSLEDFDRVLEMLGAQSKRRRTAMSRPLSSFFRYIYICQSIPIDLHISIYSVRPCRARNSTPSTFPARGQNSATPDVNRLPPSPSCSVSVISFDNILLATMLPHYG